MNEKCCDHRFLSGEEINSNICISLIDSRGIMGLEKHFLDLLEVLHENFIAQETLEKVCGVSLDDCRLMPLGNWH